MPDGSSTTSSSQQHEKYRWRGDIVHAATLLNTILFCAFVFFFKDYPSLFDSVWARDGFCISNATVPYFSSHDLCLYADLFLSAVCAAAYFFLRNNDGMEPANTLVFVNLFGVAAHGMGHGALGARLRDGENSDAVDPMEGPGSLLSECMHIVFWLGLLKASMPQASIKATLPLTLFSWYSTICIKPSFQFTHVQTILLMAFSINQLCRPKEEKGLAYVLYGTMVSFPLGIIGWIESTMCSSTIIHLGGHLCYDAYIPTSMLGFYLTYNHYRASETVKVKSA